MAAPRWLTEDEQRTWLTFLAAVQRLSEDLDRQLQRDSGMPQAYYQILVTLSASPTRSLRMAELAAATSSSPSRLSHAVSRLEEAGWVRRQRCGSDRRGSFAVLTDTGFDVLAAAAPGHVEAVRRALFDPLSPNQVEALRSICEAVLEGLSVDQPEGERGQT